MNPATRAKATNNRTSTNSVTTHQPSAGTEKKRRLDSISTPHQAPFPRRPVDQQSTRPQLCRFIYNSNAPLASQGFTQPTYANQNWRYASQLNDSPSARNAPVKQASDQPQSTKLQTLEPDPYNNFLDPTVDDSGIYLLIKNFLDESSGSKS